MKVYKGETFTHFTDADSSATFSDIRFEKCLFESCAVSITTKPALRSTVRNIELVKCQIRGCSVRPAILEDVLVDGLKTSNTLFIWGAAFKHVVVRGKIGSVIITTPDLGNGKEIYKDDFIRANNAYYESVDWGLDISEGLFRTFDIRGLPSRLIKRDPKTQVVVKREQALKGLWRKLDLSKTYWPLAIGSMLLRGDEDTVLIAPKASPKYDELLKGLMLLQEAGVAEPD